MTNFIAEDFKSGSNFKIGKFVIIEDGVTVGDNVTLGDYVKLCSGTIIGNDVEMDDYCNTTGPCTIGNNVRISKRSLISRNVIIHDNVYFGGSVITSHSKQIQSRKQMDDLFTEIHSGCVIGMRTIIAAGCTVGPDVTTGYNTLIINNTTDPGTYVGSPARKIK